jgi:glycogen phosphorylase
MPTISKFTVVPKLPGPIAGLMEIARNFCWCWDPEAIDLFFRIDRDLWIETNQNPVLLLGRTPQSRLEELASDDSFLAHLERCHTRYRDYMEAPAWLDRNPGVDRDMLIAYLSLEFGIHESLQIYSGGLGLLAGDHLKSASDLGLPLVGVGLLYREGYHTQYLNADGWQQEKYPRNDFFNMAVQQVQGKDGKQVVIDIEYPERVVKARAWVVNVGRVKLYLLDCDFDANQEDDRELTARLYGGDPNMRIRQEILLGMGAVRLLHKLDIWPSVFHMNEGHAAFMTLERMRYLMKEEKCTLPQAIESVKSGSVFTTHTPVPAGNDMFSPDMMHYYFTKFCQETGMGMDEFLALGRQDPSDSREPFCMTVLALKLSTHANGVSKLHGEVARDMWARTWKDVPVPEIPIGHITNGVHTRFWVSRDLAELFDRYLGPAWTSNPADQNVWDNIDSIPDPELWRTHERRRERLVNFARRRVMRQHRMRGAPQTEIMAAAEALDPETLTIGFARRFATYKRANLLLRNPDRLVKILADPERPVQMIIAGKAHPADTQAKELIRNLVHFTREYNMRNHIFFVEDYDINVARYMVQGVDCWLNTPRRPLEASGTSGMKVAANGGLNISVSDGWWCEAELLGENGWTIGRGEVYSNPDEQDHVESEALYELLEREIVPRFYDRGRDGLPRRWIETMKTTIRTICPVFNTHRMVTDYLEQFYLPCTERRNRFRADNRKAALELADWKAKVRACWPKVRVAKVTSDIGETLLFGSSLDVKAELELADLTEKDVTVEIYYGPLDPFGRIHEGQAVRMEPAGKKSGGAQAFAGSITADQTGQLGFSVRVIPSNPDLAEKHETALIAWA